MGLVAAIAIPLMASVPANAERIEPLPDSLVVEDLVLRIGKAS